MSFPVNPSIHGVAECFMAEVNNTIISNNCDLIVYNLYYAEFVLDLLKPINGTIISMKSLKKNNFLLINWNFN